jgi:membrane protease YdiL (CAAX protease family)
MSEFPGAVGFGILSLLVLYFARKAGYFVFHKEEMKWIFPIRWYNVITVFAIYFAAVVFLAPLISTVIRPILNTAPTISVVTWLNFLTSFFILTAVALYTGMLPRAVSWKIWRRSDQAYFLQDVGFAFLSFLIAFPLVIFLNEAIDVIVSHMFHPPELPDQLAVRFLKMTFVHPSLFFLSVVTIVAFAPMLEETLFRGFLQSFIRQHLGSRAAILITAICFSCFHYSPEQGLSNISIIGSLFALALFLGFVYEKRGSLVASMALHASFNAISILNLYFLGGFPKAL